MGWWNNLFGGSTKGTHDDTNNGTTTRPPDTPIVDHTEQIVSNKQLLRDLYNNTANGYKLAGALAGPPIDVPLNFMGLPLPKVDSDDSQKYINELMVLFKEDFKNIEWQLSIDGTVWVYPWYDSVAGRVVLDFIDDDWVVEIYRDIKRGVVNGIKTRKQISVLNELGNAVTTTETKVYTAGKITTTYENSQITGLKNTVQRNPINAIPVCFANKKKGNSVRGISDYTRILPDLNSYHRVSLRMLTELNDFNTKLIQNCGNVAQWVCNQGYDSINEFLHNAKPQKAKMVLNQGEEKTEYIFNKGMVDGYLAALKNIFMKLVEGSSLPEMFWGLIHVGNHATAENDMKTLIQLVQRKRDQATQPFLELIGYIVQLDNMSRNEIFMEDITISWTQLDSVSDSVRSEIFKNFCDGISASFKSGCITIPQIQKLWEINFPESSAIDEDEFEKGLTKTSKLLASQNADYMELLGIDPLTKTK